MGKDRSITGQPGTNSPPPVPSDILLLVLAAAALRMQSAHPASSQQNSASTTSRQHPRDWGETRATWPMTYHPGSPRSAAVPCCAGGSSPTCCWWQWHQTPASPPPMPTLPVCPAETDQRPCREGEWQDCEVGDFLSWLLLLQTKSAIVLSYVNA